MISRDLASIRYPHRGESSRSGETCLQEKKSAALARIEAQLEEILSGRRNTEPEPHRAPQSLLFFRTFQQVLMKAGRSLSNKKALEKKLRAGRLIDREREDLSFFLYPSCPIAVVVRYESSPSYPLCPLDNET